MLTPIAVYSRLVGQTRGTGDLFLPGYQRFGKKAYQRHAYLTFHLAIFLRSLTPEDSNKHLFAAVI